MGTEDCWILSFNLNCYYEILAEPLLITIGIIYDHYLLSSRSEVVYLD